MERNIQKKGLINLLMLLAFGVGGFAVARLTHTLAGQVEVVFLGLGILVAAISWFQMRLEDSERLEKLELDELGRSRGGSGLFEAKDAELYPAKRAREQFERFFVPIFTVLICIAQAGGAYFLWRWLAKSASVPALKEPMAGLFVFLMFALVLFMLGRFSATFAKLQDQRLLRPGASYLLLNAIFCAAVGLGIFLVQSGFEKADLYIAFGLCALLALIAAETVVALLLEIYRPRVKGKVERPLYESRLVGLLGQPEGLVTTAAQAIDYQFGFKVSETWFYRFAERALLWLVPLQLLLLILSTGIVIIEPGEQGLLERFGRRVTGRTVLEPGPHFKWPWPIDRVHRFRTEQIQSFDVGSTPEPGQEKVRAVLWTVSHTKEELFLVANREPESSRRTNQTEVARTPPVSLITVSIPVQYQITNLVDWAYNNEDAPALLHDLATREVVHYLAGADMGELMSHGRFAASETLVQRIQAAANGRELGARIVSVGLQDLHPPVKVAEDYEKVISAEQGKQAKILAARADEIRTNALAAAGGVAVVNNARAEAFSREKGARARAGLFTNQIPAFAAAPSVYAQRTYLQTFGRATANARKYVLLTTNTQDVITFDLQESVAREILKDVTVPAPKPK
jgi:modulator of FtsH protease HflK